MKSIKERIKKNTHTFLRTMDRVANSMHTSINNFQMDEIAFWIAFARHEEIVFPLSAAPTTSHSMFRYLLFAPLGLLLRERRKLSTQKELMAQIYCEFSSAIKYYTKLRCRTPSPNGRMNAIKNSNDRNLILRDVLTAISIRRQFIGIVWLPFKCRMEFFRWMKPMRCEMRRDLPGNKFFDINSKGNAIKMFPFTSNHYMHLRHPSVDG